MTGFAADWLALREPADRAARASSLVTRLSAWRRERGLLKVADIGAGTGSTLRAIAAALGGRQDWRLLDKDPALLKRAISLCAAWAGTRGWSVTEQKNELRIDGRDLALTLRTETCDLAQSLDRIDHAAEGLVTASALLDLVSKPWLEDLAARCDSRDAAAYIALTYDGRASVSPSLSWDSRVTDLVNRHQRRDKGFGAALGPTAATVAEAIFAAAGFEVRTAPSDWRVGRESAALQFALCRGWAAAAAEQDPGSRSEVDRWLAQRCRLAQAGQSALIVGHQDLLAVPRRSQSSSMS